MRASALGEGPVRVLAPLDSCQPLRLSVPRCQGRRPVTPVVHCEFSRLPLVRTHSLSATLTHKKRKGWTRSFHLSGLGVEMSLMAWRPLKPSFLPSAVGCRRSLHPHFRSFLFPRFVRPAFALCLSFMVTFRPREPIKLMGRGSPIRPVQHFPLVLVPSKTKLANNTTANIKLHKRKTCKTKLGRRQRKGYNSLPSDIISPHL